MELLPEPSRALLLVSEAAEIIIPDSKITGYLLSSRHPDGKHKAKFFRKKGFDDAHANTLRAALISVAYGNPAKRSIVSEFGTKYVIEGPMAAPDGSILDIRTVWFIRIGEEIPRFVTAYPND